MYGKIFDSMYEGTLYGHWQAIVTLQQMLVLCNQDGVIDMTPQAIAARTSIPLEIIEAGIKTLGDVDPYSRTPGEDGRRIVLLDEHRPWGWRLVDYRKYQQIKNRTDKLEADRTRIAEKRKSNKNKDVAECRKESHSVAHVAPVSVSVSKEKPFVASATFARFWQAYPRKVAKPAALKAWEKLKPDDLLAERICRAVGAQAATDQWRKDGGAFIPHPATWLNGRRWEDEIAPAPGNRNSDGPDFSLAVG